jgi:tRNA modification GTPase
MNFTAGPIVACSTCLQGNAGLAVLRFSGFSDLAVFQKILKQPTTSFTPRVQKRAFLVHPVTGEDLDDALGCYFPAPHSFTGESVFELSVHGNVFHVERLLEIFCKHLNFSMAEPGEFTYRAFKNGKLKLSQVEGLDLLLNANSAFVFDQGLAQLTGELHENYLQLHSGFKELMAAVELSIDFADDVGEEAAVALRRSLVLKISDLLNRLYQRATRPIGSLLDPSIVFLGAPNAGKSTIFNHLLSDERAIVSSIAGTTRDYLVESLSFDFAQVRIIDTAGLRISDDIIESEGITRSRKQSQYAFMRVLVFNPFNDVIDINLSDFGDIDLVICTHADLDCFDQALLKVDSVLKKLGVPVVLWGQNFDPNGPMGARLFSAPIGAKSLDGPIGPDYYLAPLLSVVAMVARIKYEIITNNKPILVNRQRQIIKDLHQSFSNFRVLELTEGDVGIVASELHLLLSQSQELIGVYSADEVLHHIFNNFCIGK